MQDPDYRPEGVWVAYGWDMRPYVLSIRPQEIEALRDAVNYGGNAEVVFVRWGVRLEDAISAKNDPRS